MGILDPVTAESRKFGDDAVGEKLELKFCVKASELCWVVVK